jgi:hypothetical protein
MADYLGDFAAGATVRLWWNTNAIAGESITRATDGSIRIYKDGSDTQRSSSAGITDAEDADGVTGVHRLSIDLSDDTDSGFYAAGSDYAVVLVGATIDGKTINHALGQFSIENRNIKANVVTWLGTAPLALTAQKVNSVDDHLDDEIAAILAQTNLINAGNVTYSAPVNPNTQSLALNQSQDYLAADGGQLPEWSSTAWTPFSLTTAASVTWYIRDFDGTLRSGAVNVVSDTELDVRTFANAVTALLIPGNDLKRRVQIWAVLDVAHGSAHKLLVDAKLEVLDDLRS